MNVKLTISLAIIIVSIAAGIIFFLIIPRAGPSGGPEQAPDQPFEWVSDITPGSGAGTPPTGAGDGPWNHRVMSATSTDGLTWVSDGRIIADQASVPDAVLDNDNNIRVYYVDWYNGHRISVALSHDGINWIYRKATINGEVPPSTIEPCPVDPDIVLLPYGQYRLYYILLGEGGIYSAASNHGISFAKEDGVRFQEGNEVWMDPDVVKIGDVWRMFTWKATGDMGQAISTVSSDGLSFTKEDVLTFGTISSTIPVENGYRMYYTGMGIRSAFSSDGVNWVEEGLRLDGAADPTVIRLPDGAYKMFYKTWIE